MSIYLTHKAIILFLIVLYFPSLWSAIPLIHSIQVIKNKIIVEPEKPFADTFLKEKLALFEYDSDIDLEKLDTSIVTIPFIMCAAPAVWISGKTYTVESLDRDLYYSLQRVKAVFKLFYPEFSWQGEIIPTKLRAHSLSTTKKSNAIAILFSGGLDSIATSFGYLGKQQLLITNHGTDVPFNDKKMWQNIQKQCKDFARIYGHTNSFVKFNYRSIFNESGLLNQSQWKWWEHIAHSLYHVGITAPLLYSQGYKNLYIASSETANFPFQWASHPLIDNNIRFCDITIHHDQDNLTRSEKITLISSMAQKLNLPKPHLRVCWSDTAGGNCLRCKKCLHTLNEILSVGQDPQEYGFDITLGNIIQRTKQFFQGKPTTCSTWQNIQIACKKTLMQQASLDSELFAHLNWLISLKLDTFCNSTTIYPLSQKPFFSALWQLGSNLNTHKVYTSIK